MNILNVDMKNMDVGSIIRNLQHIPKWLGVLLIVVLTFGGSYWLFSYTENSVTTSELAAIGQDIVRINKILNNAVDASDYLKDYSTINTKIDLLEQMIMYDVEVRVIQLQCIEDFIRREHGVGHIELQEFESLQSRYKNMLDNFHKTFESIEDYSHVVSLYGESPGGAGE